MERYLSFSIDNLRFIDSLQFLSASLDKLAKNLKSGDFCKTLRYSPADKVHMLLRKGAFYYDYWDCPEKALDVSLPPRAAFYSRLTEEGIPLHDYWHAVSVWREIDIRYLGEYHDLYLKTDVLILTNVFETFRSVSQKLRSRCGPLFLLTQSGMRCDAQNDQGTIGNMMPRLTIGLLFCVHYLQSYFDVYSSSFGTHDRPGDARSNEQGRARRHVLHLAQARRRKQSLHGRDV